MKKLIILLTLSAGLSASAQTISDGMDNWKSYSSGLLPPVQLEIPNGWHGSDSLACFFGPFIDPGASFVKQVYKSTDKHGGSFAARLVTKTQGTVLGALPAVLANAPMALDTANAIPIKLNGGVVVNQRYDYANAWVKFHAAVPGDEGQMYVEAVIAGAGANGDDSVIGMGNTTITDDSVYSLVSTNIVYDLPNTIPDRIRVVFISSATATPGDGTELYVDDVSISVYPAQVERIFDNENPVKVYPTVGNGIVTLESAITQQLELRVFSSTGQLVSQSTFASRQNINLQHLPGGLYFYKVYMDKSEIQRGKLVISR